MALGGRTPFQCRWRLQTALSTDREPWSEDDTTRLLELFHVHGPQWALLARLLKKRSDYELRKILVRQHRDVYQRWLRDHDVVARQARAPAAPSAPTLRRRGRGAAAGAAAVAPGASHPPADTVAGSAP